jgi:hypothetical protein
MADIDLSYVAYCGVVCAKCGALLKGKCKGCRVEPIWTRCPTRACAIDKGLTSCAECDEDYEECKKINNLIAALIRLILRRDRRRNLAAIKEVGIERFVSERMDLSKARKVPVE